MSIERNLFFQQELDSGIFSWENSHYLFDWREKVESKLRKTEEIAGNYYKDDTLGSNEIPGPICIKFVREPIVSRWSKEKKLKKKHHSVDMKGKTRLLLDTIVTLLIYYQFNTYPSN